LTTKPPITIPKAPPLPSFLLNSTTKTPKVITTQFPSEVKQSSPPPPVVNGHNKQQTNIIERKPSISEDLKEVSTVRIEIGRLEMKDLAERELNNLCELHYQNLLEEVIQSDFEKPSIPEVILAVITDLTNDENEQHQQEIEFENHNNNSIYYFNLNRSPSNSPSVINTNSDIDYYYTNMHQNVMNNNDHDTERSTDSSDQNIALIPIIDQTSDYLQVKV
jgi:hypothetical protein